MLTNFVLTINVGVPPAKWCKLTPLQITASGDWIRENNLQTLQKTALDHMISKGVWYLSPHCIQIVETSQICKCLVFKWLSENGIKFCPNF